MLSRKLDKDFIGGVKFYFFMLKQMYHIATSKTCIIDSYIIPISILNHKRDLKVVQIWHALGAIKKFGYQTLGKESGRNIKVSKMMDMHKNYDVIISGSVAMVPYFSEAFNADFDKLISLGLPRIDYLVNNQKLIKNKIHKAYPKLNSKKVILYVPTFRTNESNHVKGLINSINLSKYNLIIKSHPSKKIKFSNDRVYRCKEFTALELLTIADYVITDYSAISIEAAILEKPVYFYVYDYSEYIEKNGLNIDLYKEMPGCVFKSAYELMYSLNKKQYDFNLIRNFKSKYVANVSGNITTLLADYILKGNLGEVNDESKEKIKKTFVKSI